MADLAATDVTVIRDMTHHTAIGRIFNRYYVKIVLAGQGDGTSGKGVPASAFGLRQVVAPFTITDSNEAKTYTVHPKIGTDPATYGQTCIIQDTYHATGAKVNVTGTYYGVVEGIQ